MNKKNTKKLTQLEKFNIIKEMIENDELVIWDKRESIGNYVGEAIGCLTKLCPGEQLTGEEYGITHAWPDDLLINIVIERPVLLDIDATYKILKKEHEKWMKNLEDFYSKSKKGGK